MCFKSERKRKSPVKDRKKATEKESSQSKIGRKQKKKKIPDQDRKKTKENI